MHCEWTAPLAGQDCSGAGARASKGLRECCLRRNREPCMLACLFPAPIQPVTKQRWLVTDVTMTDHIIERLFPAGHLTRMNLFTHQGCFVKEGRMASPLSPRGGPDPESGSVTCPGSASL